ncbi:hypothetical protein BO70DRAFT_354971 [Aspergillus heteromorphus CBS 117.55]|uniref:Uncharacterized protein n=1 Tax=Aspergillus heteromorphus CBS 117.55 TaxID=1448321 RepID=A0A317VEV3_9EURO|nr:uncharacterized protein BO70DRAFT_354971 [Aspergillus heteromorphus CBS 117.55]PWY72894.1 hypothetical protein BO70DRAFT_354971 [Aspergillus heteromorphus CBS 117.55]
MDSWALRQRQRQRQRSFVSSPHSDVGSSDRQSVASHQEIISHGRAGIAVNSIDTTFGAEEEEPVTKQEIPRLRTGRAHIVRARRVPHSLRLGQEMENPLEKFSTLPRLFVPKVRSVVEVDSRFLQVGLAE